MRALADLLATPEGRALLDERGIHTDMDTFAAALRPPARPELAHLLGVDQDSRLVYLGQQVCADMAPATTVKFAAARELADHHDATPVVLWHDMDSTQSDRYGARVVLPTGKRQRGCWLAPRELEDLEPRFIDVERERLASVVDDIAQWAVTVCRDDRQGAAARVERIGEALLADDVDTLADADCALASVLLRDALALYAPATRASQMIDRGLLVDSVAEFVSAIDDVVAVFNEAVERLVAEDIDPQVRSLPPDYLPLRYSCPEDGGRVRLARRPGPGRLRAYADCRCGACHEFDFGDGAPDLSSLIATDRWSIDVSMPVHHNSLASGFIAGKSTGLYGLVFNEVLERVLGQRPIPGLVPPGLGRPDATEGDTLLVRYVTGQPVAAAVATT